MRGSSGMRLDIQRSSAAAWHHLVSTGGLDPNGYDKPIVTALRSCLDLDLSRDIASELAEKKIPIESFLSGFFRAVRPYGLMLQDLLRLFSEAGAQFGEHNLAVQFNFEDNEELGFDVEQFRQWMAQWSRANGLALEAHWNTNQLWQLSSVLRRNDAARNERQRPELRLWMLDYREKRRWPSSRPLLRRTGDSELDILLERAWNLWVIVMDECERQSQDRDDLREKWHRENRLADFPDDEDQAWPINVLASLDSDHWPASLIESIISLSEDARLDQDDPGIEQAKTKLRQLYESVPGVATTRESWVLAWEAYLDLPLWKQRHELYSAWVSTQILAAADSLPKRVHTEDRTLRFQFSGSHLATLPTLVPAVHLWAELRSPLKHRPLGSGRKSKIQPDFTLLQDPLTGERSAFLVVECKQYKKASKKNFLAALIDYGRGRPNAQIILVNYGSTPDYWLDEAPPELRDRLFMFGDFRPGSSTVLDQFQALVRDALNFRRRGPGELETAKYPSLQAHDKPPLERVLLRWRQGRDLDLHILFRGLHGPFRVAYSQRGSLQEEPWIMLDHDVQSAPGCEEIQLVKYFEGSYECFVHSYSGETFHSCEAEVEVAYKDSSIKLAAPTGGSRWWHVLDWDSRSQSLCIVNALSDLEPEAP